MRRTGFLITAGLALAAVLTVVLIGSARQESGAASASARGTRVTTVRPDLAAMLKSELSGHPSLMTRTHRPGRIIAPHTNAPHSITGWSCPVSGGSPCGARSRTEYLPLTLTQALVVVRPTP